MGGAGGRAGGGAGGRAGGGAGGAGGQAGHHVIRVTVEEERQAEPGRGKPNLF